MQKRNFARKYSNMPLLLHFEKKKHFVHGTICHNHLDEVLTPLVINVYEFQKDEKQEKEV